MIRGEYWLDSDGQSTFADGDVGDSNHEMVAFWAGIQLNDEEVPVGVDPNTIDLTALGEGLLEELDVRDGIEVLSITGRMIWNGRASAFVGQSMAVGSEEEGFSAHNPTEEVPLDPSLLVFPDRLHDYLRQAKLPVGVETWSNEKFIAYADGIKAKKKYLEDWMVANRESLREADHGYVSALHLLQKRYRRILSMMGESDA
jgi:hypothetical protein